MKDVSVIIQGNIREQTASAIRSARDAFPESEIILATWKNELPLREFALCDSVLELSDPGPIQTDSVPLRNLARQVASTRAGIIAARGSWILKTRTDIVFNDISPLEEVLRGHLGDRLGVWQNFTANAEKNSVLFHVSDILQVGRRERMLEYWPERIPERSNWYGMVPEQWLFLNFLQARKEIDTCDRKWLKPGFTQVCTHVRMFAKYLYVLPDCIANLPARLVCDRDGLMDFNYSGSMSQILHIYRCAKWRQLLTHAGKLKRLISAERGNALFY